MRAYVLVVVESGKGSAVRDAVVASLPAHADCVTGPYDILVSLQADSLTDLRAKFDEINGIPGICRSVPCIVLDG
jgi:hypothetical protein